MFVYDWHEYDLDAVLVCSFPLIVHDFSHCLGSFQFKRVLVGATMRGFILKKELSLIKPKMLFEVVCNLFL